MGRRWLVIIAAAVVTIGAPPAQAEVQHSAPYVGPSAGDATHVASDPIGGPADGGAPADRYSPSGEFAPVGNLPSWRQTFVDDFDGNPGQLDPTRWWWYQHPWRDTSKRGAYNPATQYQAWDVLRISPFTMAGTPQVSAVIPKPTGSSAKGGFTYGRIAARWRADYLDGYKMAWMLWPDSSDFIKEGEIDYPEQFELAGPGIFAIFHRRDGGSAKDQEKHGGPEHDPHIWHTTVTEWSPGLLRFLLDGIEIGRSTNRVPNTPMHWVLQTETAAHDRPYPADNWVGAVIVDWAAVWSYDPTI